MNRLKYADSSKTLGILLHIYLIIKAHPDLSVLDIADKVCKSHSATYKYLNKLVQEGFIFVNKKPIRGYSYKIKPPEEFHVPRIL
jgi:predicted transcriptional regulator